MFLDIDVNLASLSTLKKYIETARLFDIVLHMYRQYISRYEKNL